MFYRLLRAGFVTTLTLWAGAGLAADPIKVGSVLSITGGTSFLGEPEDKTLRMYVKKINDAGGIKGRPIELTIYDDGSDANKARTFATRLIEDDKVLVMIGGSSTGTTLAMLPLFESAKIPFISMAGGIEIIDPVKKYIFKTPHTDRMSCQRVFTDAKARKLEKIGLISGTDGFGASMRKQCIDVAPTYGITLVADESYGPRDSDMTAQLTKMKSIPGIQAILNPGTGQGPAIVARNHAQLGMTDIPLYESLGVASRSFIDLAGKASEGIRLPASALLVADQLPPDDPQKKIVTEYKREYEATTGQPVSTFGGQAYDAFFILRAALERAKTIDPESIRTEIENTKNFVGTAGKVTMSPTDHLGLEFESLRIVEIKNGDWLLLNSK